MCLQVVWSKAKKTVTEMIQHIQCDWVIFCLVLCFCFQTIRTTFQFASIRQYSVTSHSLRGFISELCFNFCFDLQKFLLWCLMSASRYMSFHVLRGQSASWGRMSTCSHPADWWKQTWSSPFPCRYICLSLWLVICDVSNSIYVRQASAVELHLTALCMFTDQCVYVN